MPAGEFFVSFPLNLILRIHIRDVEKLTRNIFVVLLLLLLIFPSQFFPTLKIQFSALTAKEENSRLQSIANTGSGPVGFGTGVPVNTGVGAWTTGGGGDGDMDTQINFR